MDKKLLLIENGKPLCSIVISERPSIIEKFAAEELQKSLFLMTDVEVEIVPEGNPVGSKKVVLVDCCFPSGGENTGGNGVSWRIERY